MFSHNYAKQCLLLFAACVLLAAVSGTSWGEWILVDDFSAGSLGALDGQTAANGQTWTSNSGFDIIELGGDNVFKGTNSTSAERAYVPFSSTLDAGATWTLFYRVRFEDIGSTSVTDPPSFDFDAGPSDSAAPAAFADKTHSLRVKLQKMMFSHGSGSAVTQKWDIEADIWYNVWHVMDLADDSNPQTNNTVRVYIQQGGDSQEQGIYSTSTTDLSFRDYDGGGMDTFFTMMGANGGMSPIAYIDDIYVGGDDMHEYNPIPEPAAWILLAASILGLAARCVCRGFCAAK